MKIIYLLPLFLFATIPAFANIGFMPVYQPTSVAGSNPATLYCIFGEFLNSYNSTTNSFTCGAGGGGGENNTASNLGSGTGIFASKVGVDLRFKSIVGGSGISLSNNATTVTVTNTGSGENTTATNLGTSGHDVYESEVSDQLRFKKIACVGLTCSNNSTNITITSSGGSGNMTVLDDGGDVTITSPSSLSILQYIGSQWIDKIFTINSITGSSGNLLYGINNQTGQWTTATIKNPLLDGSNHTDTVAQTPSRGSIIYGDSTPKWNELTIGASGTVLSSDGTDVSWTTPSSGSGIPMPPKKWGELIPRSASTSLQGLLTGCTILGTATYVYDTTDNSNAILSTTATTDGINGGIHCTGTNYNSFRGDQNAYMYSKWEENKITTNRIFIGFSSSATHLPNNADTILDNLSGVGLCIRTSDTVYQMCRNDGDAATDYATLTTSENTGVHYVEVYTTDSGVTWCVKLDGGTAVCHTTEIPATTTQMYAMSTGETDGGASAILWTQYLFYVQSDK